MKFAATAIVALLLLAIAIVAFAPATLLDRRLVAATAGKLRIADAEGTLWRGNGTLTDAAGAWRIPIGWRVDPLALARGAVAVTLVPPDGAPGPRGNVVLSEQNVELRTVSMEFPAQVLTTGMPAREAVTVGGDVVLDAPAFNWTRERSTGSVTAQWRGARIVSILGSMNLGTVDAALTPAGDRLAGRIGNTGGDVRIDGTVSVDAGSVGLDATITPLATTPPLVARALLLLGPQDANGAVRVSLRSALR